MRPPRISSHVTVVVDPNEYDLVLDEMRRDGVVGEFTRRRLARAAFAHTAAYDAAIVGWLDEQTRTDQDQSDALPETLHVVLERAKQLRYGENPHQRAAQYRVAVTRRAGGKAPCSTVARSCRT